MAGCDDFQVDIEKRLHGALGEAGRAPLEEHLAGCEACRAYEAAARGSEAGMEARASGALSEVDWARVERGIRGGVFAAVRMLAGAVVTGAWVALAAWVSAPPGLREERLLRVLPTMGLLVVLVAFVAAYSGRRLVAMTDRGEMLATYRSLVAANLQWALRMQWAVAALLAFFLWRAFTARVATYDPMVFDGMLAVPLAAGWAFLRWVKVPRAQREARDLGIAGGVGGA
jgi:hypothetical protein